MPVINPLLKEPRETGRADFPEAVPSNSDAWGTGKANFKVLQSNKFGNAEQASLLQVLSQSFKVLMWLVICQDKDDAVMRCLSNLFGHRTPFCKGCFEEWCGNPLPPVGTLSMQGRCAQCQRWKNGRWLEPIMFKLLLLSWEPRPRDVVSNLTNITQQVKSWSWHQTGQPQVWLKSGRMSRTHLDMDSRPGVKALPTLGSYWEKKKLSLWKISKINNAERTQ